ncbi:hypothetical protein [Methanosarcina mazei]|uniref:Uncharacterized protein n=1 Tax=Methanosarcina mazei TaxID=2209 RepID=A0A0F8HPY8_METMZ|nr:hypothetical protein [Methanosarcina mazei]KKG79812.1 hypothetical protein DU55_13140 [Methanosarcina mazei]
MDGRQYHDTGKGVLLKHNNGKTTQENTLLNYDFKADIKKITSPRYVTFKGKVNGRLQVDKHNQNSAFLIYIEHNGHDIRIPFSFELMALILEIRNSFWEAEPIKNPFFNVERSSVVWKNMSCTPKLVELLTTKRIKINDEERKQILLKNSKEIIAMGKQHDVDIKTFLKEEEANSKESLDR